MSQQRRALVRRVEGQRPELLDFVLPDGRLEFTLQPAQPRVDTDPACSIVTYAEAVKMQRDFYMPQASEIDEATWHERRGILPPCRDASLNGWEVFHISEILIYDVVQWVGHCTYTGRYFTFNEASRTSFDKLVEKFEAAQTALTAPPASGEA